MKVYWRTQRPHPLEVVVCWAAATPIAPCTFDYMPLHMFLVGESAMYAPCLEDGVSEVLWLRLAPHATMTMPPIQRGPCGPM